MQKDTISRILEYNKPEFNWMKLLEELAELNEVVVKTVVKEEGYKPDQQKLVDEIGDVLIRLRVLVRQEGIVDAVNERVNYKMGKLMKYIDTKKYKNA